MRADPDVSRMRGGIDVMETDQMYDDAMAEATKLGLMSKNGLPTERAQCPTCEAVFSTVSNFDRHLTKNRNRDGFTGPWCQPPASVGLIPNDRGIWHQPLDDAEYPQNRAS